MSGHSAVEHPAEDRAARERGSRAHDDRRQVELVGRPGLGLDAHGMLGVSEDDDARAVGRDREGRRSGPPQDRRRLTEIREAVVPRRRHHRDHLTARYAVTIEVIHAVRVQLHLERLAPIEMPTPPWVPAARRGHRALGRVHLHGQRECVWLEREALHNAPTERPRINEWRREHHAPGVDVVDLPWMIAHRPVYRVRRLVARQVVRIVAEGELAVPNSSGPRRHREDPVVVIVYLGRDDKREITDVEVDDATPALGVDDESRVTRHQIDHIERRSSVMPRWVPSGERTLALVGTGRGVSTMVASPTSIRAGMRRASKGISPDGQDVSNVASET